MRKAAAAPKAKPQPKQIPDARVKCTVAWVDKKCTKAGIMFAKLSDSQKKGLEELLRNSSPI